MPIPTGLVTAIDVSSAQGMFIEPLIQQFNPDHVITKLYQSVELSGVGARFSIAHANAARALGCSTGGYGWLYANIPGSRQVTDFLDTATRAQIQLSATNPLWLDCERYDAEGTNPSLDVIRQAVAECGRRGVACGIYTGGWWWTQFAGNTHEFAHLPLWGAVYDGNPHLITPNFGGWTTMAGHQWTSTPVDQSVFDAAYATVPI